MQGMIFGEKPGFTSLIKKGIGDLEREINAI
jgi:hypothetical protein